MSDQAHPETVTAGGTVTERASVAELIHLHLDRLTPSERKPARLLLGSYPVVGLEPLARFARRAGVSHPSILRFIAKLGFSGYADFQAALRRELEARFESPLTKHHAHESPDGGGDFLARFAASAGDNIARSIASLPRGAFDGTLELLADPRNTIHLIGGRFTDPLALYAYMHLRVLRPRVHHVSGPPLSWSEFVVDMDRRAVVVVFDIRRYQGDVVHFAGEAAERGAHIVLITDQWLSPIASIAEHVLAARIDVPSSWDSVAAIVTLVEAMIAALNARDWPRLRERIRELEGMRERLEDKLPRY